MSTSLKLGRVSGLASLVMAALPMLAIALVAAASGFPQA